MILRTLLPVAAAIGVSLSIAGCGQAPKTVQVTVTPPAPAVAEVRTPRPVPVHDPIADLIAESQRHFAAGERELALGHLEQARTSFDLAVDVLLKSPYGARTEPRIRQHFDRLVERISAHEITALAQGDGFVEKKTEPASIDELLAISTFDPPAPTTATRNRRRERPEPDDPRRRHSSEPQGALLHRAVPGPSARVHRRRAAARREVPADDSGRVPRAGACRSTSPTSR